MVKAFLALLLAAGFLFFLISDGPPESSADVSEEFRLPWAAGQRMYTLQGPNDGTHTGIYSKYAYDFAPGPVSDTGFQVRAVRSGVVVLTVDTFSPGRDCDPTASSRSNFVLLDHGDGAGSRYEHLAQGSLLVRVGARVSRGAPLAMSGRTGYVCGVTHLHYTAVDIKTMHSLDRAFSDPDVRRDGGRPKKGQWYISNNVLTAMTKAFLPFVANRYIPPGKRLAEEAATP